MNSHLENLIQRYLGDYVQEYDSSSLSIGIWQGDIKLKNLILKSQTFDITETISFHLIQGMIGEIRIQIPWTHLQSGQIKISIDNINLVLRYDADYKSSARSHQAKMNKLNLEEIKLFGLNTSSPESFSSRIMNSLASTFFQNLLNKFTLTLQNVKISILFPLLSTSSSIESKREMCHMRINLDSGVIEHFPREVEDKLVISKKLTLKGFGIDVNRVVDRLNPNGSHESPINVSHINLAKDIFDKENDLVMSLQHLLSREHQFDDSSLLSSVDISLTISVWTLSHDVTDTQNLKVQLEIKTGPIEIWPRISQILLLKSAISQFELECKKIIARRKCFHLRPTGPPSTKEGNIRSWWRYAFLWEILRLRNWNLPDSWIGLFNRVSERHTQRYYKQRYLLLYRKHIESTLRKLAAQSVPSAKVSTNSSSALSPDEVNELEYLHRLLDEDKLLLYRAMVHRGLQEVGVTFKLLLESLQHQDEKESSVLNVWGFFGQPQRNIRRSKDATDENVDAKILNLLDEVRTQLSETKSLVHYVLAADFSIPGISLILSNTDDASSKMANMTALFMLSQVEISFNQGVPLDATRVNVRIGGIRLYGLQGVELLSCGKVNDVQEENSQAIIFNVEWKIIQDTLDEEKTNFVQSVLDNNPPEEVTFNLDVNCIQVNWNEEAILLLRREICEYLFELNRTNVLNGDHGNSLLQIRLKCAQYSMTNSLLSRGIFHKNTTWNVTLKSKGLNLDFPFGDYSEHKRKSSLIVSFSSLEVSLGDSLKHSNQMNPTLYSPSRVLEETLTRSLWEQVDHILHLKYLKLTSPVIESVHFSICGISIGLRRKDTLTTQTNFIKNPWSIKGLFSWSLLPCHKSYPDAQLDVYCSPLEFSIKLKDMSYLVDGIYSLLSPIKNDNSSLEPKDSPSSSNVAGTIRIQSLASLCVWRASANFDKIQFILTEDKENDVGENIRDVLIIYCNHVFDRGVFSRIVHTVERLMIQRLSYFGIQCEISEKVLNSLGALVEEVVLAGGNRSSILGFVDAKMSELTSRVAILQYTAPVIVFCAYGIHLSDYCFTYDNRSAVQIEEILVLDPQCNPIFHLFPDSQAYYENLSIASKVQTTQIQGKKNDASKRKIPPRNLPQGDPMPKKYDSSGLASYCAVSMVYTQQDSDFGWGIGGYPVSALYTNSKSSIDSLKLPTRTTNISCSLKNVDILVSTDGLPKIFQATVPVLLMIYKKLIYSLNQSESVLSVDGEPGLQNISQQAIRVSYQLSFDCAHVVFALPDKYLAELSMTDGSASSGLPSLSSQTSRSWRFSLNSIEMHDLCSAGSHHPSILTKDPEINSPMISASFTQTEDTNKISLHLLGFRFCVLYRFVMDFMSFTTTHFADFILLEITKLTDGIKSVQSNEFHFNDLGSRASVQDSVSSEEEEGDNFHNLQSHRRFYGGFFEYPEGDHEVEGLGSKQTRGSINMFGVERLKLQRSKTFDSIGIDSPSKSQADDSNTPNLRSRKSVWSVHLRQTSLFFPRNSTVDDLIGVTIESIYFHQQQRCTSWRDPPSDFKIFNKNEILYFDYYGNDWKKGYAKSSANIPNVVHPGGLNSLANSRIVGEDDLEFYSASEGDESDFDDFQDTLSEPIQMRPRVQSFVQRPPLEDEIHATTSPITRYIFEMEGMNIFTSIAEQYEPKGKSLSSIQTQHRRFLPVVAGKPVYSIITSKRVTSWSKQIWKCVTNSSTNILFVVEMSSEKMRILLSDTEHPCRLHLSLAMSDLYLLMSIYYDNINEMNDVCTNNKPTTTLKHDQKEYPEYGTEEFCSFVHNIVSTTDILIVRSDLLLACSMDNPENKYFSYDVPNLKYLFEQFDPLNLPDSQEFPFASIHLQWLAISCRMNDDILQVALGASEGRVTDLRTSCGLFGNEFLKFCPRSYPISSVPEKIFNHGYPNYEFGLKHSPSFIKVPGNVPFQITYYSMGYSWGLCNIGSDAPDLDFRNLDLIWLLSDYFSLYFSYPQFGNPALLPRKGFEPALFHYFGFDTRVFLTRPHIQTFKNSSVPSETLILTAEKGVYYRYIYDSDNSVKMELDISDFSLILMKQYRPPDISRGLRGVAGSGKQIRTLVEYASIQFESHLDAKETSLDYLLRIGPEIHEKTNSVSNLINSTTSGYVHFGKEFLFVPAVAIPPPKCVSPLYIPSRNFPKHSCRIVTSYEDILFVIDLIMNCLGFQTEMNPTPKEEQIPTKVKTLPRSLTNPAIFCLIKLQTIKFILVDNVLGLHLPLSQIFLSEFSATTSYNPPSSVVLNKSDPNENNAELDLWTSKVLSQRKSFHIPGSSLGPRPLTKMLSLEEPKPSKLKQTTVHIPAIKSFGECLLWADYFNSMLKCWEPLLDPFIASLLHEQDNQRGIGYVVKFGSPIHLNVSLAMIRAFNDAVKAVNNARQEISSPMSDMKINSGKELTPADRHRWSIVSTVNDIEHVETTPLDLNARVGFSILNLTGYPIRYLQVWEEGNRMTVQYLQDGERGLLNFIASKTIIRDNEIIEESFTSQSNGESQSPLNRQVGHQVALQIAGFRWLEGIQADSLGVRFEDLDAVIGRMNLSRYHSKWRIIGNSLKLVAEVKPHNGGRLLQLSSVFMVKNSTLHTVYIRTTTNPDSSRPFNSVPFALYPGETFNIPLGLLQQSVLNSKLEAGCPKSLGYLWLVPSNKQIIADDLGVSGQSIGDIKYTALPIDLKEIVKRTHDRWNELYQRDGFNGIIPHDGIFELACDVLSDFGQLSRDRKHSPLDSAYRIEAPASSRIINFDQLPCFRYNVEVEAVTHSTEGNVSDADTFQESDNYYSLFSSKDRNEDVLTTPCTYTIVIHPPFVVENLLPMKGTFELVHANQKNVLWSADISSGEIKCIHTVPSDEPILLLINLDFCRSSEGVLVHKPFVKAVEERGLTNAMMKGVKGLMEDDTDSLEDMSIILTDSVGQRLRLQIENKIGGGGHRKLIVYCPYWIVNTSQYSLRLRNERSEALPAGTINSNRDGMSFSYSSFSGLQLEDRKKSYRQKVMNDSNSVTEEKVFFGRPGPLHSSRVKEIESNSPLRNLLRDLKFDQILELSCLFNFLDASETNLLGTQRVTAQLEDSTWSKPFTLESAGVNQVLSVDHAELGMLELAFKVSSAPGRWAPYTKIVRFSPRFIVVNKLDQHARVTQINGFFSENIPIDVSPNHLRPFHLPVVFGERQVAVDIEGPWMRSVPFDIDQLGSYTLKLRRPTSTGSLSHIVTRGNLQYDVLLPTGEVGIWFETDWDRKHIVVRSIRPRSYAATRTDIQPGDALIAIDGEQVLEAEFDEVMAILKEKLANHGCTLTLLTVEEKMRRIRENAITGGDDETALNLFPNFSPIRSLRKNELVPEDHPKEIAIKVEMRAIDSSIFMLISNIDERPEYRVENFSSCHTIHYRQKGVSGSRWSTLDPGQSATYIWDDPIKPHRLLLRVGKNILCPSSTRLNDLSAIYENSFSGFNKDVISSVLFDEIGFRAEIPITNMESRLFAVVESEGPTKVLCISPEDSIQEDELKYGINFINEQMTLLAELLASVNKLLDELNRQIILPGPALENCLQELLSKCLKDMKEKQDQCLKVLIAQCEDRIKIEDSRNRHNLLTVETPIESILGPIITETNMIVIQILETAGLKSISTQLSGTNEVYCEVYLRTEHHHRKFRQHQETYVNDKMIDPFWIDQLFLFKVPVTPDQPIRGYNVRVRVRSKSVVGFDEFLGEADVQFSSLLDEQELCGWFSLKPKSSSISSSPESLQVSGSIKLRAQWIHSSKGLLSYLLNVVDRRRSSLSSHLTHQQRILRKKQKIDINFTKTPSKLRSTKREPQSRNYLEPNKMEKRKPSLAIAPITEDTSRDYLGNPFTSYFSHFHYFNRLASSLPPSKRAIEMIRSSSIREEHDNFITKVEEETRRCFTHVNITSGRLEITPVQALNLPNSDYPVYIHFTYGDDRFKTFHAPPTAHPTWLNTDENNDRTEILDRSSWNNRTSIRLDAPVRPLIYENLTCSFDIDTLNIKGTICVSVKQDSFPKDKELCRLELPIFSVLDCVGCQSYGQDSYDRWFPLRNTAECSPREGDMGTSFYAPTSEKTYSNMFQYHPCIRLIIRWQPIESLPPERSIFYLRTSLPALSISMIDSNRAREIMQISISDIEIRHNHSEESTDTNVIISWLQVDNQLPESVSPVIVSPTKVFRPQPAFRLHVKKNNLLSHPHLESFDYFQIIMQELDLHLEQQIVVSVWEFMKSVMSDLESKESDQTINIESDRYETGNHRISRHSGSSLHLHESIEPQATPNTDSDIDKLYIDHFYIAPIMINISFIMNPQALSTTTSVDYIDDKKFRNGSDDTTGNLSERSTINLFLWQVGEVVLDLTSSITDAPIKLNGMTVNHLFKTWGEVSSILQDHYLNSALGQLYRIVGSLDLVGNPVGLLSSLGVGVRDFFYEPAYAIITTPTEFKKIGRGVVKGAVSLASNTADGLLGTATNVTRAFGKGVAALTMDDIFLRNRDRLNKPPLSTAGYLTRPIKDIGNGIFCGVVGIIRVPYYGAKQKGAFGFVLGVGKGIAGVAAKPVVGVLDAFTHTGDGIRYIVKSASTKRGNPPKRRRHANLFGPDGRLLPYSYSAAYGAHFLDTISWGTSAFPLANRNHKKLFESESGTEEKLMKPNGSSRSSTRIFESLYTTDVHETENHQRMVVQSRRQTLRNNFVENVHHRESVVYTAVLTRDIGLDLLVIITTIRVVVGECRQERGGSSAVILWQSKIINLKKPRLERSGGGTVSLVLDGVNVFQRKNQGENSFIITGDYEILRNLFNCLNTILHNFHLLIPLYNGDDTWEEDEHNMIQIGSWQYLRPDTSSKTTTTRSILTRFTNIMPILEECDWIFGIHSILSTSNSNNNNNDLMYQDVIAAVLSHRNIREYKYKAEYNPNDTKELADKKSLLRDSLILGEDFDKLMESLSLETELTSSAWKNSPIAPKDSAKKPSRLNKIRKSVLSKMHLLNSQHLETNENNQSTPDNLLVKPSMNTLINNRSSFDLQVDTDRLPSVDEKSDDEKADDPKAPPMIMPTISIGSSGISKLFRSSDDPPSSPHSFTRKLFQSGKKNSLSVLPTGESDREESRGDSSAQSEDIKDDSCGMHTSEMHHRVSPHTYSLLPTDGIDGDAVSALSNGDSLQISEVMDRLSRMEELLTTIIQR